MCEFSLPPIMLIPPPNKTPNNPPYSEHPNPATTNIAPRAVYCEQCKYTIITNLPGAKCGDCRMNLITIVRHNGTFDIEQAERKDNQE